MRILIFGRNGQVASALIDESSHAHSKDQHQVTACGRNDVNLLDPGAAASAINHYHPDIIINAAAYTAVDKAEDEQAAASQLNETAPGEMAQAAKKSGGKFIHLSTDYVFDGRQPDPYSENDEANPINTYGRTKLAGERAIMDANPDSVILRTSWIFSEFGGNFVKTMLRLSETHKALKVVNDQIGGPTGARDIAKAILTIAAKLKSDGKGGIYHYQGAPTVSWAEFAASIFSVAKRDITVTGIATADYPTTANRPQNTILNCTRIEEDFAISQPDWRARLEQVIEALHTTAK